MIAHSSVDKPVDNSLFHRFEKSEKFRFSSKIASKKSEKFRLLSANFSLFLCYYYLIYIFNLLKIKQQQHFFNRRNRKKSDFSPEGKLPEEKFYPSSRFSERLSRERREDPRPPVPSGRAVGGETINRIVRESRMPCSLSASRNSLGVCPAPRFSLRTGKTPATNSGFPFPCSVRGAWMPSQVRLLNSPSPLGRCGLKSCNKPSYRKLFTASLNLSISGLIASFDALRDRFSATAPLNHPADAPPSLALARARRKKGKCGASAPAFFDAPLRRINCLLKG